MWSISVFFTWFLIFKVRPSVTWLLTLAVTQPLRSDEDENRTTSAPKIEDTQHALVVVTRGQTKPPPQIDVLYWAHRDSFELKSLWSSTMIFYSSSSLASRWGEKHLLLKIRLTEVKKTFDLCSFRRHSAASVAGGWRLPSARRKKVAKQQNKIISRSENILSKEWVSKINSKWIINILSRGDLY